MINSDACQRSIMWLAAVGMLLPNTVFAAAPATGHPVQLSTISDVALQPDGNVSGRVFHTDGRPAANVPVQIRQESHLVAHAMTDHHGQFSARQVAGGVYTVSTPQGKATFRIWTAEAAPPLARNAIEMTDGHIVRGQSCRGLCGGCDGCAGYKVGRPWLIAVGIAAAIALPLALDDDDAS